MNKIQDLDTYKQQLEKKVVDLESTASSSELSLKVVWKIIFNGLIFIWVQENSNLKVQILTHLNGEAEAKEQVKELINKASGLEAVLNELKTKCKFTTLKIRKSKGSSSYFLIFNNKRLFL